MKTATIMHVVSGLERSLDAREHHIATANKYGQFREPPKLFGPNAYVKLSEPIEYESWDRSRRLATNVDISVAHNPYIEIAMFDRDRGEHMMSESLEEHRDWDNPITQWLLSLGYYVDWDEWFSVYPMPSEQWPRFEMDAALMRVVYNMPISLDKVLSEPRLVAAIRKNYRAMNVQLHDDNGSLAVSMYEYLSEAEIERIQFVIGLWETYGEIYEGE
jgi:hypothetical protein